MTRAEIVYNNQKVYARAHFMQKNGMFEEALNELQKIDFSIMTADIGMLHMAAMRKLCDSINANIREGFYIDQPY